MDTTADDKDLDSLKTAVLQALESDGCLREIGAQLTAHVMRVCDQTYDNNKPYKPKTTNTSTQDIIVQQLIADYLIANGLKSTLSVFNTEIGHQNDITVDRDSLQKKLSVKTSQKDKQIPLLTSIVKQLQRK